MTNDETIEEAIKEAAEFFNKWKEPEKESSESFELREAYLDQEYEKHRQMLADQRRAELLFNQIRDAKYKEESKLSERISVEERLDDILNSIDGGIALPKDRVYELLNSEPKPTYEERTPSAGEIRVDVKTGKSLVWQGCEWVEINSFPPHDHTISTGGHSMGAISLEDGCGDIQFTSSSSLLPNQIVIGNGVVTIDVETGCIEFGEDYNPDEAAMMFWSAIGYPNPKYTDEKVEADNSISAFERAMGVLK